jgi:hypothetical protein
MTNHTKGRVLPGYTRVRVAVESINGTQYRRGDVIDIPTGDYDPPWSATLPSQGMPKHMYWSSTFVALDDEISAHERERQKLIGERARLDERIAGHDLAISERRTLLDGETE